MANPELFGITLSVDSNEWYYGRNDHRNDFSKKILIKRTVPDNIVVSFRYAKEINELFLWTEKHEKDTAKKIKRPLYVDRSFFINPNIVL